MTPLLLAVAEEDVTAGPIGLLVVGVLGVITVLLIRNMNKRLKNLPREFPQDDDRGDDGRGDDATGGQSPPR